MMISTFCKLLISLVFIGLVIGMPTMSVAAQTAACLSDATAKKIIEGLKVPATTEKKDVRKELLKMQKDRVELTQRIAADFSKSDKVDREIREGNLMGERHLKRICQLMSEHGWLSEKVVGKDGYSALNLLLVNNQAYALQREMIPVLIEAAKLKLFDSAAVATLVDSIRVGSGQPQIFGTQATIRNEVIYLRPILNEAKVDEYRKLYGLGPLNTDIRGLERRYVLPVLKMPKITPATGVKLKATEQQEQSALGIDDENEEVLKIDTKVVNLNLRIESKDNKGPRELQLTKEDLIVLEDGAEQEITYFSSTDNPFDLILVLDFSGSTDDKRGLIKKAAERFVEYARPTDRVSVVAFANSIVTVAPLTDDKSNVINKIRDIDLRGSSPIWDALQHTYDSILKKESNGRRSAIVVMTDGADNSKMSTLADLYETARQNSTTIFPVYLKDDFDSNVFIERFRKKALTSLSLLAEETGGQVFPAERVSDLTGIYERIINDLGKVYSIGYEPRGETREGGWRQLSVQLKNSPNLIVKTRKGYYAQ